MRKIKKIALISPSVMLSERDLNSDLWLKYFTDLGLEVVITPTALSGKYLDTFQAKDKAKDKLSITDVFGELLKGGAKKIGELGVASIFKYLASNSNDIENVVENLLTLFN